MVEDHVEAELSFALFTRGLVELADMWTARVDELDYLIFFDWL